MFRACVDSIFSNILDTKNIQIHRTWRIVMAQIAQPFEHPCFFVVLFAPIYAPLSAGQEQLTKLEKSTPKKWFFCLLLW